MRVLISKASQSYVHIAHKFKVYTRICPLLATQVALTVPCHLSEKSTGRLVTRVERSRNCWDGNRNRYSQSSSQLSRHRGIGRTCNTRDRHCSHSVRGITGSFFQASSTSISIGTSLKYLAAGIGPDVDVCDRDTGAWNV